MEKLLNNVLEILRSKYDLTEEEVMDTFNDIVYRCFSVTGKPTEEELEKYIEEYMDR